MIDLEENQLLETVKQQCKFIFPCSNYDAELERNLKQALVKTRERVCKFKKNTKISPLYGTNYLLFLIDLRYTVNSTELKDVLYNLIRTLFSVDLYGAKLLGVFFEHPLGTVLGRANYGDNLTFYQGCTVGGNWKYEKDLGKNSENMQKSFIQYPTIGDNVIFYSNAKVVGNCKIGKFCVLSANSYIINQDIPDFSIVFGQSPNLVIKSLNLDKFRMMSPFSI